MNLTLVDVRFLVDRKRTCKNQHSPAGLWQAYLRSLGRPPNTIDGI